jgi:hypothetical protein
MNKFVWVTVQDYVTLPEISTISFSYVNEMRERDGQRYIYLDYTYCKQQYVQMVFCW